MISIGWRNLKRDPMRAMVTTLGVVFAVSLVTVEVGMLLGLVRNASLLIDNSRADLWVSSVDVKTFDFPTSMDCRKRYLIEEVPGVEKVEEYNVAYTLWKLPSGGNSNCQAVAFEENGSLAAPLNLEEGNLADLHNQDAVIIDECERPKLGNPKLNDTVEVLQHRAKIVGFTRGMRSFTTTPFIFTSLRRGDYYGWMSSGLERGNIRGNTIYFLVKVAPDADVENVRAMISAHVPDVEAHTRAGFSWRTRFYWLFETGVGIGFLAAALLGLAVGGVIMSQMLYAMTMDKLPEFAILKAMGASMSEVSRVVLEQGLICGGAGLLLGLLISYTISALVVAAGTAVELPALLVLSVALLTALLSIASALISISRLRRVEPALVFKA